MAKGKGSMHEGDYETDHIGATFLVRPLFVMERGFFLSMKGVSFSIPPKLFIDKSSDPSPDTGDFRFSVEDGTLLFPLPCLGLAPTSFALPPASGEAPSLRVATTKDFARCLGVLKGVQAMTLVGPFASPTFGMAYTASIAVSTRIKALASTNAGAALDLGMYVVDGRKHEIGFDERGEIIFPNPLCTRARVMEAKLRMRPTPMNLTKRLGPEGTVFLESSSLSELVSGEGEVKVTFSGDAKVHFTMEREYQGVRDRHEKELIREIDLGGFIFSFEKGHLAELSYDLPKLRIGIRMEIPG